MNYFEQELSTTFRTLGYHWHKISVASNPQIRFLLKPPYDYCVLRQGEWCAFEAKSVAKLQSIRFDRVEPHQQYELLDCILAEGRAYVLINFRKPNNVMYAIDIRDFLEVEREHAPKKSINIKLIETDNRFVKIAREKVNDKLIWNIERCLFASTRETINQDNSSS